MTILSHSLFLADTFSLGTLYWEQYSVWCSHSTSWGSFKCFESWHATKWRVSLKGSACDKHKRILASQRFRAEFGGLSLKSRRNERIAQSRTASDRRLGLWFARSTRCFAQIGVTLHPRLFLRFWLQLSRCPDLRSPRLTCHAVNHRSLNGWSYQIGPSRFHQPGTQLKDKRKNNIWIKLLNQY